MAKMEAEEVDRDKVALIGVNPKLEIRDHDDLGRGLFALESISMYERLVIIDGSLMRVGEEQGDFGIQVSEDLVLSGPLVNYVPINHSCDPNAGFKGQILLVAMRDIAPGEQITFDYAMVLHPSPGAPAYRLECKCGSPRCRGVVTENDWEIPELQERYQGYFQWYLEEKIGLHRERRNNE